MDRINSSSFPINQALRAYAQSPKLNRPGGAPFAQSVQPMRPTAPSTQTAPTTQVTPTTNVQSVDPSQRTQRADTVAKISPAKPALDPTSINKLIGAKVQPIDLTNDVAKITGPKPVTTSAGTYTMYPQAADRMQAATNFAANSTANVSLGRSLDLRG